jgi:hypothetical protein
MQAARVLSVAVLATMAGSCAFAQTTFATITGVVTDPKGAVVPGAIVTATHVANNYRYTTQSNQVGNYALGQLLEGEYILQAQYPGFKEFVAQNIQLVAQDLRRVDIRLEVGAVDTKIEVSAGATLIETETARISDSRSSRDLRTLPLNTRGMWDFLGLTPGIVQSGNGSANRRFAGSRVNQSDASIDGITMSNGDDGTQISPLQDYNESFQEMRVDMANNTAEFGSIGQVTIISKSGTNELHGSAFDYYSTPLFRARNPFAQQRGTGIRHFPGGSLGGPVVLPKIYNGRNRSFFFFSLETSRGSAAQDLLNPTVPLAPWRSGDFSALAHSVVVRDPFGGNAPFPSNRIPASRINAVSQKIEDRFYPFRTSALARSCKARITGS